MTLLHRNCPKLFGAKRKGDMGELTLPSGKHKFAWFLGSGKFTNAFVAGSYVYLFTLYDDCSKDILVEAHNRLPKNPHLPKIKSLGYIKGPDWADWDIKVYRSLFYDMNVGKHDMTKTAWYDRASLQEAHKLTHFDGIGFDFNWGIFCKANCGTLMDEAIVELTYRAADYGDHYIFDTFSRRNTGIDKKGNLVLVDPMFDSNLIRQDRIIRSKGHKAQRFGV